MIRRVLDFDGENLAVRSFLLLYGGGRSVTVGEMRKHMDRCGWPLQYCPPFARVGQRDGQHLTKGGAQVWLRHLFSMEQLSTQDAAAIAQRGGESGNAA